MAIDFQADEEVVDFKPDNGIDFQPKAKSQPAPPAIDPSWIAGGVQSIPQFYGDGDVMGKAPPIDLGRVVAPQPEIDWQAAGERADRGAAAFNETVNIPGRAIGTVAAGIANKVAEFDDVWDRASRGDVGPRRRGVIQTDEAGRQTLSLEDDPFVGPFEAGKGLIPAKPKDNIADPTLRAIAETPGKILEGLTTPEMIATAGILKASPQAALPLFLPQTVTGAAMGASQALNPEADRYERTRGAIDAGVNAIFTGLLMRAGTKSTLTQENLGRILKKPGGGQYSAPEVKEALNRHVLEKPMQADEARLVKDISEVLRANAVKGVTTEQLEAAGKAPAPAAAIVEAPKPVETVKPIPPEPVKPSEVSATPPSAEVVTGPSPKAEAAPAKKPLVMDEMISAEPDSVRTMTTPDAHRIGSESKSPEQIKALREAELKAQAQLEEATKTLTAENVDAFQSIGHKKQMISETLDAALGLIDVKGKTPAKEWASVRDAAYQKAAAAEPAPPKPAAPETVPVVEKSLGVSSVKVGDSIEAFIESRQYDPNTVTHLMDGETRVKMPDGTYVDFNNATRIVTAVDTRPDLTAKPTPSEPTTPKSAEVPAETILPPQPEPAPSGGAVKKDSKISEMDQNYWEIQAEELVDNLDSFHPARHGSRDYDLIDTAQNFMDFARKNNGEKTVWEAWVRFKSESGNPKSQLRKIQESLEDIGFKKSAQDSPKPESPAPVAESKTAPTAGLGLQEIANKAAAEATRATEAWGKHSVEVVEPLKEKIRKLNQAVQEMAGDARRAQPDYKGRDKTTVKKLLEKYGAATKDELNANYKSKNAEWAAAEKELEAAVAKQKELAALKDRRGQEWSRAVTKAKESFTSKASEKPPSPAPVPESKSAAPKPKTGAGAEGEKTKEQSELGRETEKPDPFERARKGEDSAFDDLDSQFRETYPDPIDFGLPGRPNPNQIHTPQAFAAMFNKAFAARDFDTILDAVKATSDVKVWKPFLQDLFKRQAKDPVAAEKAEWMRHVFNGTIPTNAIPRPAPKPKATPKPPPPVTPPPRPKAGATPPPKPPPSPPGPTPTRIPVDPIPGGGGKSPYRIIEDFSAAIGKQIHVLRMKKGGLGVYQPGSTTTAERFAGDLDTAAHELAGHWTDDKHGIGKPWVAPRTRSPYDAELAKFWIFGSVKPSSTLRYRRAEGIAEFIRAYIVNPRAAKAEAPTFAAYFEKTLPPEALKSINDFSDDVRRWAGEEPLARAGLNIRMEPPTLTERLWKGVMGRGFGFEINPVDRLRLWFDDPYHFAVKASKAIEELRGGKPLPMKDFELTARLLATHDSRMSDQFERGLVSLRPGQKKNAKGELEVERQIDPVTKEPMSMPWLVGTFSTKNNAEFSKDMRDTSAYMVAQRTVEKAGQLGREQNVSGIGAGIMSDVQAAKELLAQTAKDPALEKKLIEGARRYRLWAEKNIQMLVDSGRITAAQARAIRDSNQQYVDMHRLSEQFDVANYKQRGGGIGTTSDVVKRFKGSSLEIDNVYSNLLEQTNSIQKEAHRNVVMNNFTDGLRNVRELHGSDLKDFDQFGRRVRQGDKNTITVYRNGKAEHWQFAPEIFESLKGVGELQTNALFNFAMLPSKFARYMITRGPSFMIRNPLRDAFERSVQSRSGGKPWDIFQGYTQAELSRYEVFGGGQFGNYIVDRHVWNRELKKVMRELTKDKSTILLSPLKLKNAWEALGEKSEKLGRVAEFRRAFAEGRKRLAEENPGLSPQELDYNAALYAAGEARGLIDFAKAGTVMKYVNQAIPFSNAAMRGLGRSFSGFKENPARYAMNWSLYVLVPTIAAMMWNRRDEETWKEYQQLPSYRRDFFWNLKFGDKWLTIPKPHLLGVLAGGAERIINSIMGDPHQSDDFAKNVASNLPVQNAAEVAGPLKAFLELEMNRDTFRNRDIIPPYERDLKLGLRKGAAYASGAGQGITGAINVTGLEIDPRQVDHVLNSMGGFGNLTISATSKNRTLGETAMQATGLISNPPGANARDVQWVIDWAKQNGKLSEIKDITDLRKRLD